MPLLSPFVIFERGYSMENDKSASKNGDRLADVKYRLERVSTDARLASRLRIAHNSTSNRVVAFWLLAISVLVVGLGMTLN